MQILWNVEGTWKWNTMELHIETRQGVFSDFQFYVGGHLLDSISLENAFGTDNERNDRRGENMGPETKACQCVVDKYPRMKNRGHDEKDDDRSAQIAVPEKFKVLGCIFNQAVTMQDSLEERMQRTNKAWWMDVKIDRSNHVPWRKCRKLEDQVYSVF